MWGHGDLPVPFLGRLGTEGNEGNKKCPPAAYAAGLPATVVTLCICPAHYGDSSHMWPMNTYNVTNTTEELQLSLASNLNITYNGLSVLLVENF